eukprot:superscaffoldBa00000021_g428
MVTRGSSQLQGTVAKVQGHQGLCFYNINPFIFRTLYGIGSGAFGVMQCQLDLVPGFAYSSFLYVMMSLVDQEEEEGLPHQKILYLSFMQGVLRVPECVISAVGSSLKRPVSAVEVERVHPTLPLDGVVMISANDLASANVLLSPVVISRPLASGELDEIVQEDSCLKTGGTSECHILLSHILQ